MGLFDKTIEINPGDRETKDKRYTNDVSVLDAKRREISEAIKSYHEIVRIWGAKKEKYHLVITMKLEKVK